MRERLFARLAAWLGLVFFGGLAWVATNVSDTFVSALRVRLSDELTWRQQDDSFHTRAVSSNSELLLVANGCCTARSFSIGITAPGADGPTHVFIGSTMDRPRPNSEQDKVRLDDLAIGAQATTAVLVPAAAALRAGSTTDPEVLHGGLPVGTLHPFSTSELLVAGLMVFTLGIAAGCALAYHRHQIRGAFAILKNVAT